MFPLTAELRAVLQRQREQTEALQHATGQIVPWVFHRDGRRIRSYRWPGSQPAGKLGCLD